MNTKKLTIKKARLVELNRAQLVPSAAIGGSIPGKYCGSVKGPMCESLGCETTYVAHPFEQQR